jgi:hypothetical protein
MNVQLGDTTNVAKLQSHPHRSHDVELAPAIESVHGSGSCR